MFRTYQNALWQTQSLPKGTERKAKPEGKRGGPSTVMTEQQVLECRARHEYFGWSIEKCYRHYDRPVQYMRNLLQYQVRSKLIPTPADANLSS